jgi:hypothetical protein
MRVVLKHVKECIKKSTLIKNPQPCINKTEGFKINNC